MISFDYSPAVQLLLLWRGSVHLETDQLGIRGLVLGKRN